MGTPSGISSTPLGGSPDTSAVMGRRLERLLTSVGWAEGWSRSLTPVSPSSHSTISPPGRRSRSGRLPAAPAPSPSRKQVYNDGVMKIQQISHISFSPSLPSVGKHLKGFLSLHAAALHGGIRFIDAAERAGRARHPWCLYNLCAFTRTAA